MKIFQSCIWQINSTLVEGSEDCFLFDPAYFPHEIEQIKKSLPDKRLNLVFTHGDWDHIAGFSEFSHGSTIGHYKITERKEQFKKAQDFDLKWYVERNKALEYPRIDRKIDDETIIATSDDSLLFLPIPGHAPDMMATFFLDRKLVIAGDVLSDKEFPFVLYSCNEYILSLEKMKRKIKEYDIHSLIPGHGKPIFNSQLEIIERIETDLDYLYQLKSGNITGYYRQQPIPSHLKAYHEANIKLYEANKW
ncbi:MBL fold metallo-hydrolase [Peribacillus butanolivorans]|uniref:MBL fold metallo-hydrolase n=1 Tax=Peribacillus butanolivorans TaxID=421767 RepID=UPI00364D700C